jgi:hypothetical protein
MHLVGRFVVPDVMLLLAVIGSGRLVVLRLSSRMLPELTLVTSYSVVSQ